MLYRLGVKKIIEFIAIVCVLLVSPDMVAQNGDILFRSVTVKNGLNDGYVMSVTQDKFGYMWIGTLGGLNRYNGVMGERFTHRFGDTTSAPGTIPYSMVSDADGRLWFGCDDGLYEFDFTVNNFKKHPVLQNRFIGKIVAAPGHKLYLFGNGTLVGYNTENGNHEDLQKSISIAKEHPFYSISIRGDLLYIGSKGGYIIYNTGTGRSAFYTVARMQNLAVNRIMAGNSGEIWLSNNEEFKLMRLEPGKDSIMISDYPELQSLKKKTLYNDFATDHENNVWIGTSAAGLLKYNTASRELNMYLGDYDRGAYNVNVFLSCVYAAADGNIWVGKNGCVYFRPGQKLFRSVLPFPPGEKNQFARSVREDNEGNLWFGTVNGFSKLDKKNNRYTSWHNEPGRPNIIYNNSVRGIETGSDGRVWIATGGGINSYNPATGKMEFYTEKDGAPRLFYYSANRDSKGRIWFASNQGDGLYYYTEKENKFYSIAQHPLLQKFRGYPSRIVFEDSKGRLWIGLGSGLIMADEKNKQTRFWNNNDSNRNTITGNTVVDIKEDREGIIWVSTFSGVTGIDTRLEKYIWIDETTGLKTNVTSALLVDSADRLWIGSASGLYMLDAQRQQLDYYDESSGLISEEFTEHPGYRLKDGTVLMPTIKGFVEFNASRFSADAASLPFYAARAITDKSNSWIRKDSAAQLHLRAGDNSFTIWLEALNYNNPSPAWYAYKLDGFEKEWHYSNDPKIVYTNIPGGNYTLLYKAGFKKDFAGIREKQLAIYIEKHFYKTTWFWLAVSLAVAAGLYWVYRYRMNQQKQILLLERKAEHLEKEKTHVQYESLKQQLNPHFLFNSLTSLRSLIKTDAKTATGFLDGLSMVYRYILKSGNQELVMLQAEIDFVKNFTELQKIRFGDGLVMMINIDTPQLRKYIVPVTLQNLVENAIKHNTTAEDSPLVIEIYTEDEYVVVKNNLQRYQYVETSNKKGLESLQTLYRYYSEKPIGINADEHYFTVRIPLL